jgi:hypothetical protein
MAKDEEKNEKPGKLSLLAVVRDLAGLFSAIAGFFVVMLYLAGRSYMSGYFSAMNIPLSHISFTIWEYSEAAWYPIFLYSLIMTIYGGVIAFAFYVLIFLIKNAGKWLWRQLRNRLKWRSKFEFKVPELSESLRATFYLVMFAVWGLSVISSVKLAFNYAAGDALKAGRQDVLENSSRIEIASTNPQDLGDPEVIFSKDGKTNLFVYKGLRLLTFNNGKYYLFKEIDQDTCKPIQVYVVNVDQYSQVNILPAESLASKCKEPTK